MAWIESHQSLLGHRKTLRAAHILKVTRYTLIGHLHALWWWGLDNAENDGSMGDVSAEELAEAAGWPVRNASAFVEALVIVRFIDRDEAGLRLRNWWEYAGKLNAKRTRDRERKAEAVAGSRAEVAGISGGIPPEVARKSQAPTNQPTNQPTTEAKASLVARKRASSPQGPSFVFKPLTDDQRQRILGDSKYANLTGLNERIDLALQYPAKRTDENLYVREWLRKDLEKVNTNGRTPTPQRNSARSPRYATGDEVNESWDQWAAANKPEARNPAWKGSQQL